MEQTAKCGNCGYEFQTPGVAKGSTSAVVCDKCRRVVVVQGEVDPEDLPDPDSEDEDFEADVDAGDGIAWKTRPRTARPDRPKEAPKKKKKKPKKKGAAGGNEQLGKLVGAGAFMAACVGFMVYNIWFSGPRVDPQTREQLQELAAVMNEMTLVTRGGTRIAQIPDNLRETAKGVEPERLCRMVMMSSGSPNTTLETASGVQLIDCGTVDLSAPNR